MRGGRPRSLPLGHHPGLLETNYLLLNITCICEIGLPSTVPRATVPRAVQSAEFLKHIAWATISKVSSRVWKLQLNSLLGSCIAAALDSIFSSNYVSTSVAVAAHFFQICNKLSFSKFATPVPETFFLNYAWTILFITLLAGSQIITFPVCVMIRSSSTQAMSFTAKMLKCCKIHAFQLLRSPSPFKLQSIQQCGLKGCISRTPWSIPKKIEMEPFVKHFNGSFTLFVMETVFHTIAVMDSVLSTLSNYQPTRWPWKIH